MNTEPSKAEAEEARLTAYALGELDADEMRDVDKLLEESEDARSTLAEIRETALLLEKEFSEVPALRLHEEQVEAIAEKAEAASADEKVVDGGFRKWGSGLAVAACAFLFAAVGIKQYVTEITVPQAPTEESQRQKAPRRDQLVKYEREEGAEDEETAPLMADKQPQVVPLTRASQKKKTGTVDAMVEVDQAGGLPEPTESLEVPPGAAKVENPPKESEHSRATKRIGANNEGLSMRQAVSENKSAAPKTESSVGEGSRSKKKESEPFSANVAQSVRGQIIVSASSKLKRARGGTKDKPSSGAAASNLRQPGAVRPENQAPAENDAEKIEPAEKTIASRDHAPGEEEEAADPNLKDPEAKAEDLSKDQKGKSIEETNRFGTLLDNTWEDAAARPLSTFRIGKNDESFDRIRKFLDEDKVLPPRDTVRVEEILNHFEFNYPEPEGDSLVSVSAQVAQCPWEAGQRLVKIGLKGKTFEAEEHRKARIPMDIHVTFDPKSVESYRLIGYANPSQSPSTESATVTGGYLESGESMTAFYQVIPLGDPQPALAKNKTRQSDADPFAPKIHSDAPNDSSSLLQISVSAQDPRSDTEVWKESKLSVPDNPQGWQEAGEEFRLATSAVGFGMLLRNSPFAGNLDYDLMLDIAGEGITPIERDSNGHETFLNLVKTAKKLSSLKEEEKADVLDVE